MAILFVVMFAVLYFLFGGFSLSELESRFGLGKKVITFPAKTKPQQSQNQQRPQNPNQDRHNNPNRDRQNFNQPRQ